jgi:ABC-2 type transport system ATP-binding protein
LVKRKPTKSEAISEAPPLIRLENISKRYGNKLALNEVSFQIGGGEIVGLLGRNGAGKSTMMNVMTGYLPATAGKVFIRDIDMARDPLLAKRHIGYLPEQPPLYDAMTTGEYLSFVARIRRMPAERIKNEVERICKEVGLTEMRNRLIRNLSKGYRQRVGIAQAMIGSPDILILDEPTAGLDPKQIVEIRHLIHRFGRNHTVLISSHILAEIAEICERVIIIREGDLVSDSSMKDLTSIQSNRGELLVRITGSKKETEATLHGIAGITSYRYVSAVEAGAGDWEINYDNSETDIRAALFDAVASSGQKLLMSRPREMGIEDVFLKITAD